MRNAHTAYFEEGILSASPLRLVCLLYGKTISELKNARAFLAAKNVKERSAAISKACDVLAELISSLDIEQGGETAVRLQEIYSYATSRLLLANLNCDDSLIAEVLGLLVTLQEGWETLAARETAPQMAMPNPAVYATQAESMNQSWSFLAGVFEGCLGVSSPC